VHYTYQYYAQYPALGFVHWPPLFHLAEGVMFFLFGPSVVVARVTTLLFALLGLYFWFQLVSHLDGKWTAFISTVVLAGLPSVLLYEKAVMLEVPSLALCIVAIYFWVRYLEERSTRLACWFGLFAGLALLTKQQSVFLAPFCLIALLITRRWRLLWTATTFQALAICLLIAAPFYALSLGVDISSIKANLTKGVEHIAHPYTYYLAMLPARLGKLLLGLSVVGIASCFFGGKREASQIMLAWIAAWYLVFTLIATKDPRYVTYWVPPFVYFAVALFTAKNMQRLARPIAVGMLAVLVARTSWSAWNYERPYVSGYNQVAQKIVSSENGGVVLFDGDLAGNFIFFMRANDPRRHFVVLRKALYVTDVMPQFGSVELVHSQADLDELLKEYGIKYVVVEKNARLEFNSQKILRKFLQTPRFRLAAEVPIASNMLGWKGRSLQLYENVSAGPPTERLLTVKMLSTGRDIVMPLDTYLKR